MAADSLQCICINVSKCKSIKTPHCICLLKVFTNKHVNKLSKERTSETNQLVNHDTHIHMYMYMYNCFFVFLFFTYIASRSGKSLNRVLLLSSWIRKKQEGSVVGGEPKASCQCGQDVRHIGVFTPRRSAHAAHTGLAESCAELRELRLVYTQHALRCEMYAL